MVGDQGRVTAVLPSGATAPKGPRLPRITARWRNEPDLFTSKWAVTGMMKCLALELGQEGIAGNAVTPSGVGTVLCRRAAGPSQ